MKSEVYDSWILDLKEFFIHIDLGSANYGWLHNLTSGPEYINQIKFDLGLVALKTIDWVVLYTYKIFFQRAIHVNFT